MAIVGKIPRTGRAPIRVSRDVDAVNREMRHKRARAENGALQEPHGHLAFAGAFSYSGTLTDGSPVTLTLDGTITDFTVPNVTYARGVNATTTLLPSGGELHIEVWRVSEAGTERLARMKLTSLRTGARFPRTKLNQGDGLRVKAVLSGVESITTNIVAHVLTEV